MKKHFAACALALFLFATGTKAGITTAVFDFENQPTTSGGGLTSLSLSNQGLTITIDRAGQPFDIGSLGGLPGTASFGFRTLAPTPPGGNSFNVNFAKPVTTFTADLGDFGAGMTDSLTMTAFTGPNGTGTNLGTTSASLPLNSVGTMAFKTLTVGGTAIGSVQMTGGTTALTNSVFYDNFQVSFNSSGGTSIPLPAAAYVMPFGAAIAWLAARRLRSGATMKRRTQV